MRDASETNTRAVVLVFGAERARRKEAAHALEQAGYRVRLASSMAEAAKGIAAGDVGVVVVADASTAAGASHESARFDLPIVTCATGDVATIAEKVHQALEQALAAQYGRKAQVGDSE